MSSTEENKAYKERTEVRYTVGYFTLLQSIRAGLIPNVVFEQTLRGSDRVNHMAHQGEESTF